LEGATAAFKKPSAGKPLLEDIAERSRLDVATVEQNLSVIAAGLKRFQPYCLRHSALTRLAESGCDAFTLARIAGHSSITITQRYCHPQAESVERAFAKLSGHKFGHNEKMALSATTNGETATDSQ
jgi:integrase